ncbi:MAG TPA: recombinase family protein [Bacillus bacterium]|nr:recombinase family protein [Bacillus sp. (in: firmicutes)]
MVVSRNVTVIPAIKRVGTNKSNESKPKIRVAAYCRVSTDSDEQASSYEIQIEHYTNYIKKNTDWELAGIFADDGITGTNTKKREEFNRMIDECMAGNIDMIITKSISRFARNTLDCLKYIRQLKDKNIAVFFEKENINTMDSKGEIMLTIMASLAQQESQSLSQNVKLGIQYRYQQGEVQVNHKRFLGYTKDENKQLVIDPKGAEVVKRIYREYLEGASLLQIARGLETDGILTAAGGKSKWRPETLKKILQNEKYIGDALLQKTYTVDFLSKKRVKNNGIVPQYYVENSHEPIIPRELFMRVQEEMVRRANLRGGKGGKKRICSSKYALSSIVYCGQCGDIYRRLHWNNRGYKSIVWRCVSRLEEKDSECTAPTINEETLQKAVVKAINELLVNKEPFLQTLQKNIATVFNEENDNATDDIDSKLEELQQQLLIQAKSKNDYEDVAAEIYRLRELKQNALVENVEREGKRQRIAEMTDFLNEQSYELEEYDEQLVRRLIEKVTIYEDKLIVEFKYGIEIDEEI